MRSRYLVSVAGVLCCLVVGLRSLKAADVRTVIAIETVDLVLDGKIIGKLPAGTSAEALGEKQDDGLTLVRFTSASGQETMGLARTSALIESRGNPPSKDESRSRETRDLPSPTSVDFDQRLTATELAEHLELNRAKFPELEGKTIKVDGVVEKIRVLGEVGSMLTAEITLKTRTDLPKVRLLVHASEFMNSAASDRFEMRVQGDTLEGRSRDTRSPYDYWYSYNGYWRSRRVARSEWMPIISIGHPVKGSGVLGKYHIHVELDGAKIDKS